ncbi:unnamed protein product [Arabis nemorensis]|uniref:Uncharacterized protein n=1 Tax=Arabis nemorensis TaxID=586526 RepID=A0A565CUB8_9BRAS|nr:unnamed protein product [Arabis nemorensis]
MESSMNKREHGHNQDYTDNLPESKRRKLPALASVIVEAVKVDSLQRLCSSLEPLFRRIVSEEVERALSRLGNSNSTSRSEPKEIQGVDGRSLQIRFRTRMPPHLFTGGKVEGEQGSAIHVVLIDANTGNVVEAGEESKTKLNIVVLDGDFNDEDHVDWTREHFESFEVKEREGKRPILTGDRHVILKEGVGTLGELTFTDNSSWIRSRKFRLGVKAASGFHIREAKTEPFAVKDHRGELYKKHYPPALHDEVWRLDRIAKDGALHKKLLKSNIRTVEDFLRILVKDPQKLRSLLGSGMSNRMWENTVEHAKTCVLGGKLYVYYTDLTHNTGVVFNHIYEFRGLIANGHFLSLESLNHDQKISADILVKTAYENWHKVVEYDDYRPMESSSVSGSYNGGLEDILREEIRMNNVPTTEVPSNSTYVPHNRGRDILRDNRRTELIWMRATTHHYAISFLLLASCNRDDKRCLRPMICRDCSRHLGCQAGLIIPMSPPATVSMISMKLRSIRVMEGNNVEAQGKLWLDGLSLKLH